jgi:hypothetical protein
MKKAQGGTDRSFSLRVQKLMKKKDYCAGKTEYLSMAQKIEIHSLLFEVLP